MAKSEILIATREIGVDAILCCVACGEQIFKWHRVSGVIHLDPIEILIFASGHVCKPK